MISICHKNFKYITHYFSFVRDLSCLNPIMSCLMKACKNPLSHVFNLSLTTQHFLIKHVKSLLSLKQIKFKRSYLNHIFSSSDHSVFSLNQLPQKKTLHLG